MLIGQLIQSGPEKIAQSVSAPSFCNHLQ